MNGQFTGSYSLFPVPDKPYIFLYMPGNTPLTFSYISANGRLSIVLDQVFETDLATIPRWLWWHAWLNPLAWIPAALVHDWLWEQHRNNKDSLGFYDSNIILAECCRTLGVPEKWCRRVKKAVDWFGKKLWFKGEELWHERMQRQLRRPYFGSVLVTPKR